MGSICEPHNLKERLYCPLVLVQPISTLEVRRFVDFISTRINCLQLIPNIVINFSKKFIRVKQTPYHNIVTLTVLYMINLIKAFKPIFFRYQRKGSLIVVYWSWFCVLQIQIPFATQSYFIDRHI